MMLIRKKFLKIQERLGMNIGVAEGVSGLPSAKTVGEVMHVLDELYKVGFRALILSPALFSNITSASDLYKEYYGDLLRIKNVAKKLNIELSLRLPSLPEFPDETLRLYSTIASVMDCRTFIIPPTFYPRVPPDQSLKLVVYKINEIVNELRVRVNIGVETTGSIRELGSVEDVIDICRRTRSTEPVLNWAHIHARSAGLLKNPEKYQQIIEKVRQGIGMPWLKNAFFLFSGVRYGPSGEIDHISFLNSDLRLEHLIRSAMVYDIKGTLIFEEPEREKRVVQIIEELGDMVR
jgi:hypothetical protein